MRRTSVLISYFTANGRDWVIAFAPYNSQYVEEIRRVKTARYDMEDRSWCCEAQYGKEVEALVLKHFPELPLSIQEHRGVDLYANDNK